MTEFTPGQRWLSESETELGLGLIKEVDYRLVTVSYPAVEEERTYAKNNAPLSRITFDVGDTLTTGDGLDLVVKDVEDHNGLVVYHASVSYTHLTLPTKEDECRSRWSPYH